MPTLARSAGKAGSRNRAPKPLTFRFTNNVDEGVVYTTETYLWLERFDALFGQNRHRIHVYRDGVEVFNSGQNTGDGTVNSGDTFSGSDGFTYRVGTQQTSLNQHPDEDEADQYWSIEKIGFKGPNTVTLNIDNGLNKTKNIKVNWGDGTSTTINEDTTSIQNLGTDVSYQDSILTKTYTSGESEYEIKITGYARGRSERGANAGEAFVYGHYQTSDNAVVTITSFGEFKFIDNLCLAGVQITSPTEPNMVAVNDMADCFNIANFANFKYNTANMLPTSIGNWNVSNVTTFERSFNGMTNFNRDISSWNVGSSLSFANMFQNNLQFDQDLSTWNVSTCENFNSMFLNAKAFVADIGSWNMSNATNLGYMFYGTDLFNSDISGWDTANVDNFEFMFAQALVYNQPVASFTTTQQTPNMRSMFNGALQFNQPLPNDYISTATDAAYFLADTSNYNQSLNNLDISNLTSLSGFFFGSGYNGPLFSWDVSSIQDFSYMFASGSFNGDLQDWTTTSATDFSGMFQANSVFNRSIPFDTSNVTNMSFMFDGATAFTGNGLNIWDTSNVSNMESMFRSATAFNGPIGTWNVASVSNMNDMFNGAATMSQDLGGWQVPLILSEPSGFSAGSSLTVLPDWGADPNAGGG